MAGSSTPIDQQNAAVPHQSVYVAQTPPPSPVFPSQTYPVSVTMMNTGSETWTAAEGYGLGSQNPRDNSTWGLTRVGLPYSVAPNQRVTFTFLVTAPARPGTYDFQWRMVHESIAWFGDVTPSVQIQEQELAPPRQAVQAGYDVGPNYHSTSADFANAAFIPRYHEAGVRAEVIGQLQAMADGGASVVKTTLWQVGYGTEWTEWTEPWHLSFPLSNQELLNIQTYAGDVAMTRRPGGQYLDLQLTMQWLGCAEYTRGSFITEVGDCGYKWSEFIDFARTSIASLVQRLAVVYRPDGRPAVSKLYLDAEVMIGAKPNQEKFLLDLYPYFLDQTTQAGLDGSIYFTIVSAEADILDDAYVDVQYPRLAGHKSLFWIYRSVAFLVSQGLPLPDRFDFSFYPDRQAIPYALLVDRVLDDFQRVFPGRRAAVAETYYFEDAGRRAELGQAFGAAYLARGLPEHVSFWPTPYGGVTPDVGPPFDIAAFALKVPDGTLSNIAASASPCIVPPGEDGCSTIITWSTTAKSATAAVWVNTGAGEPTLFACGKSGQASSPRILSGTSHTLSLYATPACDANSTALIGVRVATVDVSASEAQPVPPTQVTIEVAPNPCLLGGSSTCTSIISWHTAVLSGTARVFVKQGNGAPQLFGCGLDGQQQAPWIQPRAEFTFTLDAAPTCDASPQTALLASVTVTAR